METSLHMDISKPLVASKSFWGLFGITLYSIPWGEMLAAIEQALAGAFPGWAVFIHAAVQIVLFLLGLFGIVKRESKISGFLETNQTL